MSVYTQLLVTVGIALATTLIYLWLTKETRAVQNAKTFASEARAVSTANAEFKPIADAAENAAGDLERALEDLKTAKASGDISNILEAQKDFDESSEKAKNVKKATKFVVEALNSAAEAAKAAEMVEEAADANPTDGVLAELKRDSAGAAKTAKQAANEAISAAEDAKPNSAQASAEAAKKAATDAVSMAARTGAPAPKPPEPGKFDLNATLARIKPYWKWIVATIVILAIVGVLLSGFGGKAPGATSDNETRETARVPSYAVPTNKVVVNNYGSYSNAVVGNETLYEAQAFYGTEPGITTMDVKGDSEYNIFVISACGGPPDVCEKMNKDSLNSLDRIEFLLKKRAGLNVNSTGN